MENAGEKEALMDVEGEISDASDEDFDDEGEVDVEDGKFERHVVSLPPIAAMHKEDEADRSARLVDCEFLFEAGDEDEDEDDNDNDNDNNNNNNNNIAEEDEEPEPEPADEAEEPKTDQGAAGPEPMEIENEIDGVGFIVRPGLGRKSLHAVIEAMQAKAGVKAQGYDESDGFIDDAEVEAESVAGLLDTEGKKPYRYEDFRVSVDFDVGNKEKGGRGGVGGAGGAGQSSQQKKKALKPLKDLNPPASEELKAAISHFREVAKLNSDQFAQAAGKKIFNLPEVLVAPLTRLAKAIQSWHPSKHLKEELFEYVADVLPPNIVNLKAKAKRLIGGTTPKNNDMSSQASLSSFSSQMSSQMSQDVEDIDMDDVGAAESSQAFVAPVAPAVPTPAPPPAPPAAPSVAPAAASVTPKSGKKVALDPQKWQDLKALVQQAVAKQLDAMNKSTEKEVLRFKFDDELLQELEAVRSEVHNAGGSSAVTHLYAELGALFPPTYMTNKRLTAVLTAFKKKSGSANKKQKGEAAPIDVDLIEPVDESDEGGGGGEGGVRETAQQGKKRLR